MRRKKKPFFFTRLLHRLFPHSPFLRIFFVVILFLSLCIVVRNGLHYYEIHQQEAVLLEEREALLKEREELENKKQSLQDAGALEQKARDKLGLVKPGEVPYVR